MYPNYKILIGEEDVVLKLNEIAVCGPQRTAFIWVAESQLTETIFLPSSGVPGNRHQDHNKKVNPVPKIHGAEVRCLTRCKAHNGHTRQLTPFLSECQRRSRRSSSQHALSRALYFQPQGETTAKWLQIHLFVLIFLHLTSKALKLNAEKGKKKISKVAER